MTDMKLELAREKAAAFYMRIAVFIEDLHDRWRNEQGNESFDGFIEAAKSACEVNNIIFIRLDKSPFRLVFSVDDHSFYILVTTTSIEMDVLK